MTDEQRTAEVFSRRLYNFLMSYAIATEDNGLRVVGDDRAVRIIHELADEMLADLKAGKAEGGFEPVKVAAGAAMIAATAFAIVRNNGLLNRIDFPELTARMEA